MIPKFRAWDKNNDNMILPNKLAYLSFDEKLVGELLGEYIIVGYDFSDVVLMQSTGLKDRNEVEIFDGDILAYQCTYEIHGTEEVETSIVDFKNTVPFLKRENIEQTLDDILLDGSEYKVIGNIYEHKHLLEEE